MRIPLIVFLVVALLVSARADGTEQSINALVKRIRAELPGGWGVLYEKKSSEIEVIRLQTGDEPSATPKPGADGRPRLIVTAFVFRVMPEVSTTEYSRLKAKNATLRKEMAEIWARIGKLGNAPGASFTPKTVKEMTDAARYAELERSLHALPEYYFQGLSLRQMPVAAEEIRGLDQKEVVVVREKILKVLSRF